MLDNLNIPPNILITVLHLIHSVIFERKLIPKLSLLLMPNRNLNFEYSPSYKRVSVNLLIVTRIIYSGKQTF